MLSILPEDPGDWDKYIDADEKAENIVLFLRDKTADSLTEVIDRINKYVKEESLAGKPIKAFINDQDRQPSPLNTGWQAAQQVSRQASTRRWWNTII